MPTAIEINVTLRVNRYERTDGSKLVTVVWHGPADGFLGATLECVTDNCFGWQETVRQFGLKEALREGDVVLFVKPVSHEGIEVIWYTEPAI